MRTRRTSLNAWPADQSWRSFVEGMPSFGFEETGHYYEAETHGRAAVAADLMDMWAAHSVTHALHMQARWDRAIVAGRLLTALDEYQ